MPRIIRQLRSDLRKAGSVLVPKCGKGSHTVWVYRRSRKTVTVSGNDGDDALYCQEQDVREAIVESRQRAQREGE